MKPARPLLIFDGDCYFCRGWVARWSQATGDRVEYRSRQQAESELPPEIFERSAMSVQLILPDGRTFGGAEAVFLTLKEGGVNWPLWLYKNLPGFAPASEAAYGFVAEHRPVFSMLHQLPVKILGRPESYVFTRLLLLRAMAFVYFLAFVSLAVQVTGLIGHDGLLPADQLLDLAAQKLGPGRYWFFPTLCWFNCSNAFLLFLSWGGAALSLLLMVGVAPAVCSVLCWCFYLSLVTVGGDFLMFQWDALLLEAGFLTIWLAPWRWWEWRKEPPMPPALVIWLFRLLVFRFILFNGIVKLLSGDPYWRNLTALDHHYFTQPLPTIIAWWVIQLPLWFHKACCFGMFVIEFLFPFGIFLGRRLRLIAAAGIIALQLLIAFTGNYGFFNLLTIVITLSLLDDDFLRPRAPVKLTAWLENARPFRYLPVWRECLIAVVGTVILYFTVCLSLGAFEVKSYLPDFVRRSVFYEQRFELVNFYGAFAIMTPDRPEIIIEGSDDGVVWKEYSFKYKPGDVARAPVWAAPHQPRLDWQMWFAALGAPDVPFWFERLLQALLENNRDITTLLKTNPFPDRPPQYVRAAIYQYQFVGWFGSEVAGHWWQRQYKRAFVPQVSLKH